MIKRFQKKWHYPSKAGRVARILAYTLWILAGAILLFNPSQVISGSTRGLVIYVWALFIVLGGCLSLVGSLFNLWIGEFIGLPLTITALAVYGFVIVTAEPFSWARFAFGLLFFSLFLLAISRWQGIRDFIQTERLRIKLEELDGDAE